MKPIKNLLLAAMVMGMPLLLFSCRKNLAEKEEPQHKNEVHQPAMLAVSADLPGRTLAANCFQCHGTNGYAGELKIASMDAEEITRKFAQFKAESPRSNIMNLHAYAYTPEEIQLIGEFFAQQQ